VTARAAIYFTPPRDSDLARFSAAWLGRDMATGSDVPRLAIGGLDSTCQVEITRSPRHYGFHATLKAPFELAPGAALDDVRHALANFVAGRRAVQGPRLALRAFHGFLALMFAEPSPQVDMLAQTCVETFERFRAPLSDIDLARRREADLTPHQDELLQRWGYPYVEDEFRFHMTLTEQMSDAHCDMVQAALAPHVAPFCTEPLALEAVSLVAQEDRRSPFVLVERIALKG